MRLHDPPVLRSRRNIPFTPEELDARKARAGKQIIFDEPITPRLVGMHERWSALAQSHKSSQSLLQLHEFQAPGGNALTPVEAI